MPSAIVEDYPAFREYAQRYGADEASFAVTIQVPTR
jgi:hypothetical protein